MLPGLWTQDVRSEPEKRLRARKFVQNSVILVQWLSFATAARISALSSRYSKNLPVTARRQLHLSCQDPDKDRSKSREDGE